MNQYLEQSGSLFAQMQEQLQRNSAGLFAGMSGFSASPPLSLSNVAWSRLAAAGRISDDRTTNSSAIPPGTEHRLCFARLPQGADGLRAHPHLTGAPRATRPARPSPGADLVIVNTCGFIDDAVKESLDTIGEALAANGKVIVTGCLGAKCRAGWRQSGASRSTPRCWL
jgi:hypothetical protein